MIRSLRLDRGDWRLGRSVLAQDQFASLTGQSCLLGSDLPTALGVAESKVADAGETFGVGAGGAGGDEEQCGGCEEKGEDVWRAHGEQI